MPTPARWCAGPDRPSTRVRVFRRSARRASIAATRATAASADSAGPSCPSEGARPLLDPGGTQCPESGRAVPGGECSGDFQNPSDWGQGSTAAEQAQAKTAAIAFRLAPDLFVGDVFEHHEDLTRVFVARPRDVFRALTEQTITQWSSCRCPSTRIFDILRYLSIPRDSGSTSRKSSVGACGWNVNLAAVPRARL